MPNGFPPATHTILNQHAHDRVHVKQQPSDARESLMFCTLVTSTRVACSHVTRQHFGTWNMSRKGGMWRAEDLALRLLDSRILAKCSSHVVILPARPGECCLQPPLRLPACNLAIRQPSTEHCKMQAYCPTKQHCKELTWPHPKNSFDVLKPIPTFSANFLPTDSHMSKSTSLNWFELHNEPWKGTIAYLSLSAKSPGLPAASPTKKLFTLSA